MEKPKEIVKAALNEHHIHSYKISDFTISDIEKLAELARNHEIKVEIFAEHSNFHQGVLVEVYKWPLPWKCDFKNMPVKE